MIKRQLRDVFKRAITPPGPAFATPRDYFLALSEYQRRKTHPLKTADLTAHELRVSSQNGEDGIVQEILRRTHHPNDPFFVEFGIQDGKEGNAVLLADLGWPGLFMEADAGDFRALERKYRHSQARTRHVFVNPENIEQLLIDADVPKEPAVLSIDVDGEDYWIWSSVRSCRPILVIIEYNPDLPIHESLVQAPKSGPWTGTNDFGASLGALVKLGEEKGYRLVHTDTTGSNAFFVRADLPGEWPLPRIAGSNYWLQSSGHPAAERPRRLVNVSHLR